MSDDSSTNDELGTLRAAIKQAVTDVREQTPLAQSFTNFVTINLVANAQLAAGGTAAMSYLPDDVIATAEIAGSNYINVGTLLPFFKDALPEIARKLHTTIDQLITQLSDIDGTNRRHAALALGRGPQIDSPAEHRHIEQYAGLRVDRGLLDQPDLARQGRHAQLQGAGAKGAANRACHFRRECGRNHAADVVGLE